MRAGSHGPGRHRPGPHAPRGTGTPPWAASARTHRTEDAPAHRGRYPPPGHAQRHPDPLMICREAFRRGGRRRPPERRAMCARTLARAAGCATSDSATCMAGTLEREIAERRRPAVAWKPSATTKRAATSIMRAMGTEACGGGRRRRSSGARSRTAATGRQRREAGPDLQARFAEGAMPSSRCFLLQETHEVEGGRSRYRYRYRYRDRYRSVVPALYYCTT